MSRELLKQAYVIQACPMKWSKMKGDERVRYCKRCEMNVYNFTAMSAEEANALLKQHEGQRLCGRMYTRNDGTFKLGECISGRPFPVRIAITGLLLIVGVVLAMGRSREESVSLEDLRENPALRPLINIIDPPVMGKIAIPRSPSKP